MTREELNSEITEIVHNPLFPELTEDKVGKIMSLYEQYFSEPPFGQMCKKPIAYVSVEEIDKFFANKHDTGNASNIPTGHKDE